MNNNIVVCSHKCVYIPSDECVVLSDLHLGVVDPNASYPVMEHDNIDTRIHNIIDEHSPTSIVFNGDIFSNKMIDDLSVTMMESYDERVEELIFVCGNHEEKRGGYPEKIRNRYEVRQNKKVGSYLIHHGHHTPPLPSYNHVIGHVHPQKDGRDVLMYGQNSFFNSDVIILPKFSNYVSGSEIANVSARGHCPLLVDGHSLESYQIAKSY